MLPLGRNVVLDGLNRTESEPSEADKRVIEAMTKAWCPSWSRCFDMWTVDLKQEGIALLAKARELCGAEEAKWKREADDMRATIMAYTECLCKIDEELIRAGYDGEAPTYGRVADFLRGMNSRQAAAGAEATALREELKATQSHLDRECIERREWKDQWAKAKAELAKAELRGKVEAFEEVREMLVKRESWHEGQLAIVCRFLEKRATEKRDEAAAALAKFNE
jgi:hypothetical protein